MFPGNYFAKTYFAPGYWASAAAVAAGGALLLALHGTGGAGNVPVIPPIPPIPEIQPSSGGFFGYVQPPKVIKHVKLSGNTWQEQETYGYISIKHELAAQHKVFAFANTGQQQDVTGSITLSSLSQFAKPAKLDISKALVSTHYQLNVATAQSQSIIGVISASHSASQILADDSNSTVKNYLAVETPNLVIGLQETSQVQHIVGKITLSEPVSVSTHSLATASTSQVQEVSGKIVTNRRYLSISAYTSEQRQGLSGSITTNDDDEMLQVLLALLELDDEIT